MNQRLTALLLAIFLFWPVSFAFGQAGLPVISNENSFDLSTNPENPAPGQSIIVSLNGNTQAISNAEITWYLDGVESLSRVGAKDFSFITDEKGGSSSVRVVINLNNGERIIKDLLVLPAEVDLIWEAVSYTPPFYKGKGLLARQGQVKVVAIPHLKSGGREVPADRLIYNWKKNGENVVSASGYARDVYQFRDPIISRPVLIELEVTDSSLNLKANNAIVINPTEPTIALYENHPLYGLMLNKTISSTHSLFRKEINVWAAPFYFATETQNSRVLSYRWSINGVESAEQNNKRFVIFRAPDNTQGQSEISVEINNVNSLLQFTEKEVRFSFDTRDSVSAFSNL